MVHTLAALSEGLLSGRAMSLFHVRSALLATVFILVLMPIYPVLPIADSRAATSSITEGPWQAMGPRPIGSSVASGIVSTVAVADANTVYIGSESGGVWKTTDGGTSWRPLIDDQPCMSIGRRARPHEPWHRLCGARQRGFSHQVLM